MRLDVALLPLLSHQLSVKQVMLKGAVIQLTPQTEAVRSEDAPVAPRDNTLPDLSDDRGWSFDISSLPWCGAEKIAIRGKPARSRNRSCTRYF